MIPSPALGAAERLFGDLVWTPGVKALELALEASVPFLALPVVRTVYRGLLEMFARKIYEYMVLFIDIQTIRLCNEAHQEAFDIASLQLKVISIEKGPNSDEYIQARQKAVAALSKFVRIGG